MAVVLKVLKAYRDYKVAPVKRVVKVFKDLLVFRVI